MHLPNSQQTRQISKNDTPSSIGPLLVFLSILSFGAYSRSWSFSSTEVDVFGTADDDFSSVEAEAAFVPRRTSPPLRGCRGEPTSFKWVFPNGTTAGSRNTAIQATTGTVIRTIIKALDANGRPAKAMSCSALQINHTFSGHARLVQDPSLLRWGETGELELHIQDDVAEDVTLRIQVLDGMSMPMPGGVQTSTLSFLSGSPQQIAVNLRPVNSGWLRGPSDLEVLGDNFSINGSIWPTHVMLEVLLSARDRLGNRVPANAIVDMFQLRSSARDLDLLGNGHFEEGGTGVVRTLIRGSKPGAAELHLTQIDDKFTPHVEFSNSSSWSINFEANAAERLASPSIANELSIVNGTLSNDDAEWQPLASEVRDAFRHAWRGYRRYAWGTDELKPLSKKGQDSFGNIGMSVLDSLTTLHIMGLHDEFEQGADFVDKYLDFDSADREVSVFELTIRALGGLLGAHSLTGRSTFLQRAIELGDRILPALNSSSGFPLPRWNIARQGGALTGEPTILAEAGSLQLEFRYLTAITGDIRYGKAADACFDAIVATGVSGLVPVQLTPPDHHPPQALNTRIAMGALADSYYEYLLKQWLQHPAEERFKNMWLLFMEEFPNVVRPPPASVPQDDAKAPKYKMVELAPGGRTLFKMDHLSCFAPGMIALGVMNVPAEEFPEGKTDKWVQIAEGLTSSCVKMWTSTKTGLAPEYTLLSTKAPHDISEVPSGAEHSFLRPETAESLFYLYRLTGKNKYRKWGKKLFKAIITHAKTEAGYASVSNVNKIPTEKIDNMQSFVLAETFKYLYLLFSPKEALDLDKYVLNTEAHPLRRLGPQ